MNIVNFKLNKKTNQSIWHTDGLADIKIVNMKTEEIKENLTWLENLEPLDYRYLWTNWQSAFREELLERERTEKLEALK